MFSNSGFIRFFGVLSLFFALSTVAFADTVRLKDGRIIKGKITNFGNGKFTVTFDDGARSRQMNLSADEVESIVFDANSMPATSNVRTSNPVSYNPVSNNTVITVGQINKKEDQPISSPNTIAPEKTIENASPPPPSDNVVIPVKVLADNTSNGWTNSGWVVRRGQKIKIIGSGRISLGNNQFAVPGGTDSLFDNEKLIKNKPTGGLIAVVGDDNNDFIFVGDSIEFTAVRDGALFLGINEGNLNDNSGAFDVKIEISPEVGN